MSLTITTVAQSLDKDTQKYNLIHDTGGEKKALAVGNENDRLQSSTEALCTFSYLFIFFLICQKENKTKQKNKKQKKQSMVTWAVKLIITYTDTQNV